MATNDANVIVVGQILALFGVALGGLRSVQRYAAVRSLTPPLQTEKFTEPELLECSPPSTIAKEEEAGGIASGREEARGRLRKSLPMAALIIVGVLGSVISTSILSWGSRVAIDTLWVVLNWFSLYFFVMFALVTTVMTPVDSTLAWAKTSPSAKSYDIIWDPIDNFRKDRSTRVLRYIVAPGIATAIMLSAATGPFLLFPLPAFLLSFGLLTNCTLPALSVQRIVRILTIIVATTLSLFTIIGMTMGELDFNKQGHNSNTPSPWLISVLVSMVYCMPLILPGVLISINMRYDYSRDAPAPNLLAPGAPSPIPAPRDLARFKPTVTLPSLVALAASLVIVDCIALAYPSAATFCEGSLGMFAYVVTVPITLVVSALTVWARGELRDWWAYAEIWNPKVGEGEEDTISVQGSEQMPIGVADLKQGVVQVLPANQSFIGHTHSPSFTRMVL